MTEFMQRTSKTEKFKNPVQVAFRTDLMSRFYDDAGKAMKSIGAHYFGHNLIKNCLQEGHTVSAFGTNTDWQEKYWNTYWDCDALADSSQAIAKINGCAIIPWRVIDPDSDCMEDRKSICKMNDGFSLWVKHYNGVFENFYFGWEKYDVNRVNRKKLETLSNMVTDFRIQHFKLNRDMFEDGYPAVGFV